MSDYGGGDNDVRIIPLRDVYFLSDGNEDYNDSLRLGNKTTVMLLAGMCFLLLLFAILNYVNMTTALSGFRAKEMATRRLIGATKGGIFMKMIVESTIICAAAMIIAVLLGEAISPAASKVLNRDEPSALRAPSLPGCAWAPPAYGRGWPRFAAATFWIE